ncbi:MAG TPA: pentapeptide repeat-containing protein, partial [Caulobacteraceae bacterium]|nr:pentapeptide repeat-containing protein [Caulobacteraceae bacterium]
MLNQNRQSLAVAGRLLGDAGFSAFAAAHEKFLRGSGGARAILRFVEAPGVDARRRLLNDADFTGANLRGASFAGSHLERAAL